MNCPKCSTEMVKARASNFGPEYDYCRTCKKELAEIIPGMLAPGEKLVTEQTWRRAGDTMEVKISPPLQVGATPGPLESWMRGCHIVRQPSLSKPADPNQVFDPIGHEACRSTTIGPTHFFWRSEKTCQCGIFVRRPIMPVGNWDFTAQPGIGPAAQPRLISHTHVAPDGTTFHSAKPGEYCRVVLGVAFHFWPDNASHKCQCQGYKGNPAQGMTPYPRAGISMGYTPSSQPQPQTLPKPPVTGSAFKVGDRGHWCGHYGVVKTVNPPHRFYKYRPIAIIKWDDEAAVRAERAKQRGRPTVGTPAFYADTGQPIQASNPGSFVAAGTYTVPSSPMGHTHVRLTGAGGGGGGSGHVTMDYGLETDESA